MACASGNGLRPAGGRLRRFGPPLGRCPGTMIIGSEDWLSGASDMPEFYLAPVTISAPRTPESARGPPASLALACQAGAGMPGHARSFTVGAKPIVRYYRRSPVSLPPLVEPAAELTVDEVKRYSRHLIIPDVGMTGPEAAEERESTVRRGWRPRLARAALPRRGRRRHPRRDRLRRRRRVQPAAPDHPRPVRHRQAEGAVGAGQHQGNQPIRRPSIVHEEALTNDNVMQIFSGYDLIVDGTDNFATRYMVNDACVLLGKPYVWGSILPLRRAGERVLGRVRPVLPLPVSGAAASRHGAVLRRGRSARRAVRLDRIDPGQRGDQAPDRHRRADRRAADDLRRARDELPDA